VAEMPSTGDNHGRSRLGFLLGVTHRERRRAWEAQLADLHITAPQAALPRLVSGHPGRGIRLLARKLATDLMNVQRLADSLAHRQLLETRVDPPDARRRPLYPTTAGQLLAVVITDRAVRAEKHLADQLGSDTYKMLLDGLTRLTHDDRQSQQPCEPPTT
jgi:DNA-binding MarR family transcriptional regulator